DLVEDHPPHRHLRLEDLDQVPCDGLPFAVFVGGQVDLGRLVGGLLQLLYVLASIGGDDVDRLEAGVYVHAQRRPLLVLVFGGDLLGRTRQVPDVAHGRFDDHVVPEVLGDLLRLGGRLDDHQCLAHAVACDSNQPETPRVVVRPLSSGSGLPFPLSMETPIAQRGRDRIRRGAFARLWWSQAISSLGDWVNLFANFALATRLAGGGRGATIAVLVPLVGRIVPGLFFGFLGGLIADRWSRKTTMIVSDFGRAVLVLGLLFVRSYIQLFLLILIIEVFA